MGYINFDKSRLVNLEYSLNKEILRTSRTGSYSSTTIVGCNTRKYHGLLVCPIENFGGGRHVLLSSLDISIVEEDKTFNLAIHKYKDEYYSPKGHKYIKDFIIDDMPSMSFEVGPVKVKQERLLAENSDQLFVRYSVVEANGPVRFRFRPLLAFRSIHSLTLANMSANTRYDNIMHGIRIKMYEGFPWLNMQFSKKPEFVAAPDWYRGIEYAEEQSRGYDFIEDLFVPGYFDLVLNPGENAVFSAATKEVKPAGLKARFTVERKVKSQRDNFRNCLLNAAQQFIVRRNNKTSIMAGYHWYGSRSRDTFISLPGLTLSRGDIATCREILDTQLERMKGPLLLGMGSEEKPAFNSVDSPLWFIWAIQQYRLAGGTGTWKFFGEAIKSIIEAYSSYAAYNIGMKENGLLYAGEPGKGLTWMDSHASSGPVTPRMGYNVEINALWFNAVCFALEVAGKKGDLAFTGKYSGLPEKISSNFINLFWDMEKCYLADFVDADMNRNMEVRPNMLIAASLPYSMLQKDMMKGILDRASSELLTPRGLRSLSPKNPNYKGLYRGDQESRETTYHQGTVWPWLIGPYCETYLKVYGAGGIKKVRDIVNGFEEVMNEHGISTVSEIYDGDPPHMAGGTISQAWSVAEILRILDIIDQMSKEKPVAI